MISTFGLVGKTLGHSFSRHYFNEKFHGLGIPATYENFELHDVAHVRELLAVHPELRGFNVTIPYKETILPFLDDVESMARKVGAVNTVLVEDGQLIGFNTDVAGFRDSLADFYPEGPGGKAVVFGTGGASKAVLYALEHYFAFERVDVVSRNPGRGQLNYDDIAALGLQDYRLLINATPVGMYPNVSDRLPLPYESLHAGQYLYDLIYNPERTVFLAEGAKQGCRVQNGMDMLLRQAEAAWEIWHEGGVN